MALQLRSIDILLLFCLLFPLYLPSRRRLFEAHWRTFDQSVEAQAGTKEISQSFTAKVKRYYNLKDYHYRQASKVQLSTETDFDSC